MDSELHIVDIDSIFDVASAAFDQRRQPPDVDDELVHAVVPDVHMFRASRRSAAVLGSVFTDGDNPPDESLKEDQRGNED